MRMFDHPSKMEWTALGGAKSSISVSSRREQKVTCHGYCNGHHH